MDNLEDTGEQSKLTDKFCSALNEIFCCFICLDKLEYPLICLCCQKLCCSSCVERWLRRQKRCPHCRSKLTLEELGSCKYLQRLTLQLERSHSVACAGSCLGGVCKSHEFELSYFDVNCGLWLCTKCLESDKHNSHQLETLDSAPEKQAQPIRAECERLRVRLDEINSKIVMLSDSLCEEKINDIEKLKARTEKRLKDTKLSLMEKKNISEEEIKLLEPIREQVEHLWSGGLSKASLMYSVEELSAILNEIHRCFETSSLSSIEEVDPGSEICPPYSTKGTFRIDNYVDIIKERRSEVVLSQPVEMNGLTWRLEVHPLGRLIFRNIYVAVYLKLVHGSVAPGEYDFVVTLVKPSSKADTSHSISREHTCVTFSRDRDGFGWLPFCPIHVVRDGFTDEQGGVTFEFSIRPSTYYQLCRDQQRYIKKLEELVDSTEQQQERKRRRKEGDSYSSDPDSTPQVVE